MTGCGDSAAIRKTLAQVASDSKLWACRIVSAPATTRRTGFLADFWEASLGALIEAATIKTPISDRLRGFVKNWMVEAGKAASTNLQ
jgi:hypothetical protein